MLRSFYRWLVRFHPAAFRDRFGEEMLSIFDQSTDNRETPRFLTDGFVSLVRQWVARPEYWDESVAKPIECSSNGAPVFFTLDDYRPRTGSLIWGGFVTLILFCAGWVVSEYTWTHPVFMPLRTVQVDTAYSGQSESSEQSPLPLASIPSQPAPVARDSGAARIVEPTAPNRPTPPHADLSPSQNTPVPLTEREAAGATPILRSEPAENSATTRAVNRATRPIVPLPIDEDVLQSYVGVYAGPHIQIAITEEDRNLTMRIRGETTIVLVPTSGTEFRFADSQNGWVKFLKDRAGAVREVEVSRAGRELTARRIRTKTTEADE
jgi:hypothetical protein